MKYLVLYSSATGNTEIIAEAIYDALPQTKEIKKITADYNAKDLDYAAYDLIFLGYWVDKGVCDKNSKEIFETIHNKNIALFGTMGAKNENYAESIGKSVASILQNDNKLLGKFMCQGKIPEALKLKYIEMLKHTPDDENIKHQLENHEQSQTHPDSEDLNVATEFAKSILKLI